MKLLSTAQMRALDRHAIDDLGIPGIVLMEHAGEAVVEVARGMVYDHHGPVVVLCGKGNNGGDGLVVARLLHDEGFPVRVVLPFVPDTLSPDARLMFDRAMERGVPITETIADIELAEAGVVVDALLGTGVTGPVYGVLAELITRTNALRAGRGVLAVDLPSGVDADSGQVPGVAIQAAVTVTLAAPKPCLVLYPAAALAGRWSVAEIGFPPDVVAAWSAVGEIPERAQAASWLPKRPLTAYKGSVGTALLIAGSFGMTGAAAMAATAAYRSGVGLVRLALPASLVATLNATLTEVVFRPMPAIAAGTLGFAAVARLLGEADQVQATLIGPGLSRHPGTQNAVRRLVAAWPGSLVVDADALTAMAGHDAHWQARKAPTVITPHPGEMARLLGEPTSALEQNRLATAVAAARRFNAVTVFKGTPAVIASPDGRAFVNPTGTPVLAVAGTGDVLAGTITALIAQGVAPLDAAVLGTYAGGRAAEMLTAEMGMHGITALDLLESLPYAFRELA